MPHHYGHSRRPIQPRISGSVVFLGVPTSVTDSPSGARFYGPDGSLAIDVVVTDSAIASRYYGPDGQAQIGVTFGPDSPAALRGYGPDGTAALDLAVTDRPQAARMGGPDGSVSFGLLFTDTPSAGRFYGPDGTVRTDTPGAFNVALDPPSANRHGGPDGSLALGVAFGDLPSGIRFGGPDGFLTYDIVLSDSPSATRGGVPDGVVIALLSDTPGGMRGGGPDGSMGIDLPFSVGNSPSAGRYLGPDGLVDTGIGADTNVSSTPGAGRYGGPDGIVLLAFLPSKPPYIPIAPKVSPAYSVWLADTVTGRMLWSLPFSTLSWDITLNDIGTIRTTLVVEDAWDALSDQDERNPRATLREVLSGTWRFCLVVKWGNNIVWAGPYLNFSRSAPSQVELNGAEIAKIFSKRVLINPLATAPGDITGDTVMGPNVNKRYIAAALINQAMSGTGKNLPINATLDMTPGLEYRTYYGYDLAYYWDQLKNLTQEIDGPEVRFDPKVTQGSDANYLSWDMQIGSPHLGRNISPWTFDSDINSIIGLDADGSNIALNVYSAGNGQSRDKLIVSSSDLSLLSMGWPVLESVDTSHTSEVNYPVLAASNAAVLSAWKKPVISFKTQVPADVDPMAGTYRVGEDFAVDIHNDPLIPGGTYSRRIAGLAGTESPWVTITDTDPLPVGAS
jgi:hypothetical protein